MKRIIITIFTALFCVFSLAGCNSAGTADSDTDGKGVRIFVTLSEADTFRNNLVEAARKAAEESGAEFVSYDAQGSLENQVAHIKQAVNEKYDVIMCAPVDADTAQELEALAGDIPIIFYNSCPDESVLEKDKYIYVGSDEKVAGQYQAEYILDNFSGNSEINVVILKGAKSHSAVKGRGAGLKNTLAKSGKKINYVFEDYANWGQDMAERFFDIFLRTGKKADVVVCQNDTMAIGVIEACKANGIKDMTILGIDATTEGCAAIKAGNMDFTVYQSAKGQGEMAVKAAIALGKGESVNNLEGLSDDGCYIWVPFEKVNASNVSDYD